MKILIPFDFTKNANNSVDFAVELINATGGTIHLIHAVPIDIVSSEMPTYTIMYDIFPTAKKSIKNSALDFVNKHKLAEGTITSSVEMGDIASAINNYIKKESIDFICMHSHNKTGPFYKLFGSTSEQVLLNVKAPILFLHGDNTTHLPLSRSLFLFDDKIDKSSSIEDYIRLNNFFNSHVDVLHYIETKNEPTIELMKTFKDAYQRQNANFSYELMVKYADDLLLSINEQMLLEKYDMTVFIKRDRSFFSELFTISTSMHFMHKLNAPMLVLHG